MSNVQLVSYSFTQVHVAEAHRAAALAWKKNDTSNMTGMLFSITTRFVPGSDDAIDFIINSDHNGQVLLLPIHWTASPPLVDLYAVAGNDLRRSFIKESIDHYVHIARNQGEHAAERFLRLA